MSTATDIITILRFTGRLGWGHAVAAETRLLEDICITMEERERAATLIERNFGVEIELGAILAMKTVGELIRYVEERE